MIGSQPGDLVASFAFDGGTDALSLKSIGVASFVTTTPKRKWRVTLNTGSAPGSDQLLPVPWVNATAGAGARALLVSFISAGIYDVENVDFTGAAADGVGLGIVAFYRINSIS